MNILSKKEIKYIYHIADIHIRNTTERNEEYEEVFNELYNELKKEPIGVICICGDIYHGKSQISSESLMMFHKLLKISEIMPVIIISGNHDGSTSNNELKDSIEGSIYKYEKNVKYINKTDTYVYGNVIFSVKHFFDNKELIKANTIKSKKIKIALYHSAIDGARYDNNEIIKGTTNISTFNGYDMVLLGDIHKYQIINERIAYSSSLIQQNYGEDIKNHGYIKWTISKKPILEFKIIKNNYIFITLRIIDNQIIKENQIYKNWFEYIEVQESKKIRLKIYYKNTSKKELDNIISDIIKNNEIIELNLIEEKDYTQISNMEILLNKKELYDKMIDKYIKNNSIDDDIKDEIKDNLYKSIISVKEVETKKYEIKRLEINNMFCYGENNIIDFTKYKNIIGLFSENYSGKSSIIDCILEIIYDTNSKGLTNKEIIRIGQKSGSIKMLISLNDTEYVIDKKYRSMGTQIDLTEVKTNKKINCDDNAKTIQKIKDMFPSEEVFKNIHCILQGDNNGLVNTTAEGRMKYVLNALGLNDNQHLKIQITSEKKQLIKSIDDNKKMIDNYRCMNDNEKDKLLLKLNELNNIKEEYINELNKINNDRYNIKINNVKDIDYDILIKKLEINLKTNNLEINSLKKQNDTIIMIKLDDNILIKNMEIIKEHNIQKNQINLLINNLIETKHKIINYDQSLYDTKEIIENKKIILENNLLELKSKIKIINIIDYATINDYKYKIEHIKKLEDLDKYKYNNNCKICIENNQEIINQKKILSHNLKKYNNIEKLDILILKYNDMQQEYEKNIIIDKNNNMINIEINKLEIEYIKINNELEKINKNIKDYETNIEKIKENKIIDEQINVYQIKIDEIDNYKNEEYELYIKIKKDNDKKLKQKEELIKQINNKKEIIEENKNKLKKLEEEKILYIENIASKEEYKKYDSKIKKINEKILELNNDIDIYNKKIKDDQIKKELSEKYNDLQKQNERELRIKKVLEIAYDYNGITKLIINEILPNMEKGISNITLPICGYTVEIDEKLNININRTEKKYKIQNGSGSEKLIVNIGFRLMMAEFGLTLCKSSMMIIDESFVSFDKERKELIPLIIKEIIKRYDKLLIISHMEELKDIVQEKIEIKKLTHYISKII